ncbi:MAG: hypothetical protein OQK81_04670 [Candidatus Bathyarchaeota archaeon]|nr:hypothetical protein [Candidatus Bathyarchaeota archaeon]
MDLIDKVIIPEEINGKTLTETSEQLTKAMETINQDKIKWFRALAPYFIISRRRFEASLKRAEDPYNQFVTFFSNDYKNVKMIEDIPSKIEYLQQSVSEIRKYKNAKQERKQKLDLLEKQIAEIKQEMNELQNKGELKEFDRLKSDIDNLTKSVKLELRHLEKPLVKLQTLVNNPGYSLAPDVNDKLDQYLASPFEALGTENEGYPLLKTILQKINFSLDNKKMKLKASRLRKAKDQIKQIVDNDSLNSLQAECKMVLEKKDDLFASGAISEVKTEKSHLQECLKDLEIKKGLLEAKDTRLVKEYEDTILRVDDQKNELESNILSVVGQKVNIIFD